MQTLDPAAITPEHTPQWMAPFLCGCCAPFALALSALMPEAEFVAIGHPVHARHFGLRQNGRYMDVRGAMDEDTFCRHFGLPPRACTRADVERAAGQSHRPGGPYLGVGMTRAREAARRAFPALRRGQQRPTTRTSAQG